MDDANITLSSTQDQSPVAMEDVSEVRVEQITEHLWMWARKSKQRRDAYWSEFYAYTNKNNWISIPLIIVTSLTGMTSITTVSTTLNPVVVGWLNVVLAVVGSILAAMMRYFKYGERAEQCKAVAKNYTRIAYNIEFSTNLFSASHVSVSVKELNQLIGFVKLIRRELELLINETNDIPDILQKTELDDVAASPLSLEEQVKQSTFTVRRKSMS